jgi:hypothetical protein
MAPVAPISIQLQIPTVARGAMAEIFANVPSYELAYPRRHKPCPFTATPFVIIRHISGTNALSSMAGDEQVAGTPENTRACVVALFLFITSPSSALGQILLAPG